MDKNGLIKGSKYKDRYDVVGNLDGTYRIFDKNTSFQSDHITSKKDGEQKDYFNENQIRVIIDTSKEWRMNHGYKT